MTIHSSVSNESSFQSELETASGGNAEEQLAIAERELLEARSTYTVRRKAVRTILMTDPILKAVHLKAATPAERYGPNFPWARPRGLLTNGIGHCSAW